MYCITIVAFYWYNEIKKKTFSTSYQKKMKLNLIVYLLCVCIIGFQGIVTINNFKKDLLTTGTETSKNVSNTLTSYSQYLQSLN